MISDRIAKKKIPYFFLFALSFYPIMKANIASITAILFLASTLFIYWTNFNIKYKIYGLKPVLANCGFYLFMLISILYSDSMFTGFKAMQASLMLLFFPLIVFYFLPKINLKTLEYFSYGFIISNFILLLYFYYVLVEGLAIDRFSGLMEASLLEQLRALNTYPYEFVLSKAEKHLELIYESHKVYISLHFLAAILLSFNLIYRHRIGITRKALLGILIALFVLAIVYTQAIATVFALGLILIILPFIYFKKNSSKLGYLAIFILFGFIIGNSGLMESYKNKNTTSIFKFIESVTDPSSKSSEKGIDKRVYIYNCAISLVKHHAFFGYGVGNVQKKLNGCYQQNGYIIAEFKSEGFDINSHNYYLNVWLSAGVLALLALGYMFLHNFQVAFTARNFTYVFFLMIFVIGLMTENILVRMAGVFLFAIFNSLFYSISTCNGRREG